MNPRRRQKADLIRLLIIQNPTFTTRECEDLANELLGGRVRNTENFDSEDAGPLRGPTPTRDEASQADAAAPYNTRGMG